MSVPDGTELKPYSWEWSKPESKECYKYKDTIPGKYSGTYLGTFGGNIPETRQDGSRTDRSTFLFDNNFKLTHIDSHTDSAEFNKFKERKIYDPDGKMTNIVYYNEDIEVTPCMSAESPKSSFWSSLFGRGGRAKRTRRTMPRTKRRSSKSRSRHHTRSRKS